MRKAILLFWCLVSFGPLSRGAELPPKTSFHLFLLVGQSNMAGRGKLDAEAKQAHPRVLMLDKDRVWAPALDPLHFDKPRIVGVGPGRAFGNAVAERDSEIVVGLIPCAVGGSPIATWESGVFYEPTKSHPWDDTIKRAQRALNDGTLKGILWHQGESDSKPGLAEVYEAKLHDLTRRLRSELGAGDVPFIVGQLGNFKERPWNASKRRVDQAHRNLPLHVAKAGFVSAENLTHKGDEVHFDTRSARELGRRFYKAWVSLVDDSQDQGNRDNP